MVIIEQKCKYLNFQLIFFYRNSGFIVFLVFLSKSPLIWTEIESKVKIFLSYRYFDHSLTILPPRTAKGISLHRDISPKINTNIHYASGFEPGVWDREVTFNQFQTGAGNLIEFKVIKYLFSCVFQFFRSNFCITLNRPKRSKRVYLIEVKDPVCLSSHQRWKRFLMVLHYR